MTPDPSETGLRFDAAPFGRCNVSADGRSIVVAWYEPRKIAEVGVVFRTGQPVPERSEVRVAYWRHTWDGAPDPPPDETGVGGFGWVPQDDLFNGVWQPLRTDLAVDGPAWRWEFPPTGPDEFPDGTPPGVAYRKTLKIRLSADAALPACERISACTTAVLRPVRLRLELGRAGRQDGDEGEIEVYNGRLTGLEAAGGGGVVDGIRGRWRRDAGETSSRIVADLLHTRDPGALNHDGTIVTVRRSGSPGVSFSIDDLLLHGWILVEAADAFAAIDDDPFCAEAARAFLAGSGRRTLRRRVDAEEEQTLARAWGDMPLRRPLDFVHGVEGNRNVFGHEANGDLFLPKIEHWFRPLPGRDTPRMRWGPGHLRLRFGFPEERLRGGRELLDGHLPVLRTWWQDGPVFYEQTAFADLLEEDLRPDRLPEGDAPTVLRMKIRVVNTRQDIDAVARLRFGSADDAGEETVRVGEGVAYAHRDGERRVRFLVEAPGETRFGEDGPATALELPLPGGCAREILVSVPSATLDDRREIAALRSASFDGGMQRVLDFWRARTAASAEIVTPESWLNDFHRAHARHLLINCVREVGSDRRHAHVGSFVYGVFPSESAMMITDLDRRGLHAEAEDCLDSFLHYQGSVGLPGDFRSREGVFYGAGGHEHGGYNQGHGWMLWCMAEHWRLTRDRRWMDRAAPALAAACEWIIRERQATMTPDAGARPGAYGLLPAGSLEDVTDYRHWFVTNAASSFGFSAAAGALADVRHPGAARLVREAAMYREDVIRAVGEARSRSPVVRLRDGTWAPHVPSHPHQRGRSVGWLRETLEGALNLLLFDIVPARSREAGWILDDYEDNLYIVPPYGYVLSDFDRFWFSRGGFSMQSNLLGGPLPYLERDEIPQFLRAFFNGFASAFDPEVRMCCEHALPELGMPRGDHFKTSDEAQVARWLRMMFVFEEGDDLHLGRAIPRPWLRHGGEVGMTNAPSWFGTLAIRYRSNTDDGGIEAEIVPPERNPPDRIFVRFRHPAKRPMRSVKVNGAAWHDFDADREWVVLPGATAGRATVAARYG